MKAALLLCILCLTLGPAAAQTPVVNRAAVYAAALPLYADDLSHPLDAHIASRQTFASCRLERLTYTGANGQRVPALLFTPLHASKTHPAPCLLALHGYGGGKETLAGWAFDAATAGYATLAIDLWGQGERAKAQAKPTTSARLVQRDLETGVPQSVRDARRGLDYLETRPEIDPKRFGLVGFSLGAIVGTVMAGVDKRIKVAVLVSGGGGWAFVLRSLAGREYGGQRVSGTEAVDWTRLDAALAPYDPLTFAPHIAPRPLLMVNGRRDTTIFPAAAAHLYAAAQSGANPHVRLVWLPNGEHIPDTDIVYPLMRAWLKHAL